jgi:hypothetical protein
MATLVLVVMFLHFPSLSFAFLPHFPLLLCGVLCKTLWRVVWAWGKDGVGFWWEMMMWRMIWRMMPFVPSFSLPILSYTRLAPFLVSWCFENEALSRGFLGRADFGAGFGAETTAEFLRRSSNKKI